jgi:pyruvate,water dikinase
VRSSASSEDTEASFAGQHSTVLNVGIENLTHAYKEVVASNFNPRAIFYRRNRGYLDQNVTMSVACVVMINAKMSGVMYTVDPNDSRHGVIMISAVWGLAVIVVEGSTANDFYQIDKKTGYIEISEIATKEHLLRPDIVDGLKEETVPDHMTNQSCLDSSQIKTLVEYGLKLESHYGFALDVEWAIDHNNRVYILQARPLRRSQKFGEEDNTAQKAVGAPELSVSDHELLLKGGASASDGTACGLAYVLKSDHYFHHVPEGAILITRQTSPRYVPLMGRVHAIITDIGSVTGHMASVAREFRIPTLVGTGSATDIIPHGAEITVDATNKTVYRGRVESLLTYKKPINPMKGSPIYKTMQVVLKKIAPLNLTDPKQDNFSPEGCQTVHDVIRFAHEMAMQEMFHIREDVEPEKTLVVPLRVNLPLQIYIIDLGKGLTPIVPEKNEAAADNIASVPFKALLKGMTHKDIDWAQHAGLSWRGFGRIVAESMFRDPLRGEDFGGPSYAIISARYLNFSARLGYHFTTIDTYCGPKINDNYITFSFKGGAADIARRSRRALLIALILKQLGFKVEQKGDMVRAEIKKYESKILKQKLDMLGRLLGAVRLLDMVLSDDQQIEWYVQQFFSGNYAFHVDCS